MKQPEMNKINRRIQEFKDAFQPNKDHIFCRILDKKKRNQAKRLSKKLRGK